MTEIELKEFSVKDNNVSLGGLGMGVQQVGGSGGITQETDPTVPQWAKQPNKPTYDYSEIENTPDLEKIEEETELAKNKAEIALTTAENAEQNAKNYTDQKFNGANKAVSFVNYSSMITSLNTLPYATYNIGQNIMIITLEVPDLWVSGYEVENVPYTYVSDTDFVNELKTNGSVQVGHYILSALETQKVDLTDYVKNTDIDSELSETSTNPVENQAVTKALDEKLDKQNLSGQGFPGVYVIDTDNIQKLFKADKDDTSTSYGSIVRRFGYGDVYLPKLAPSTNNSATPKKWVLDQIANAGTKWYKHNIFVNIKNVTYFNMQIITTSQTAIEYNGNGLVIQGAVIGNMYYGSGGSTSNELQQVGILVPFAETYYPTMIVFGSSGLPEIKNFLGGIFPSDVTEFIDTPTEL